jgi:hypothetical protein
MIDAEIIQEMRRLADPFEHRLAFFFKLARGLIANFLPDGSG